MKKILITILLSACLTLTGYTPRAFGKARDYVMPIAGVISVGLIVALVYSALGKETENKKKPATESSVLDQKRLEDPFRSIPKKEETSELNLSPQPPASTKKESEKGKKDALQP